MWLKYPKSKFKTEFYAGGVLAGLIPGILRACMMP